MNAADILTLPIEELTGKVFKCDCGRDHPVNTRSIIIESGAMNRLAEMVDTLALGRECMLIADERTWEIAGKWTKELLTEAGREVHVAILKGDEIHADEHSLGALLIEKPMNIDFYVAVGSGTINDTTRYLSYKTKVPYIIVGTAPSMDGFASTMTPLLVGGFKRTVEGIHPDGILCDIDILKDAPAKMIAAGVGDMMGKLVALVDWRLARDIGDEYYCDIMARMMQKAVDACTSNPQGLAGRDPAAIKALTDGLVLAGLAMQMSRSSRAASGFEHHISHFWEMRGLIEGTPPQLHGDKVGVGTIIAMDAYKRFFEVDRSPQPIDEAGHTAGLPTAYGPLSGIVYDELKKTFSEGIPQGREERLRRMPGLWAKYKAEAMELYKQLEATRELIKACGGPVHPSEVDATREDLNLAMKYAMDVRQRYTLLRLMEDYGCIDEIADVVTKDFYD